LAQARHAAADRGHEERRRAPLSLDAAGFDAVGLTLLLPPQHRLPQRIELSFDRAVAERIVPVAQARIDLHPIAEYQRAHMQNEEQLLFPAAVKALQMGRAK
jgi:hypothetical protein